MSPFSARALALLCMLKLASTARAQDEGEPTAPASPSDVQETCDAARFVVLDAAPDLDTRLSEEIATDLSTELQRRGLGLCFPNTTAREPAAVIHLAVTGDIAALELDDRTTQKRVFRDLKLGQTADSGRALAIAIAIDELLRASWAELTMREGAPPNPPPEPAPEPAEAATPPSVQTVRETRKPRRSHDTRLGLGGLVGYLHGPEQFDAFSLAVTGELRHGALWLALSLGALAALPREHALGEVSARGLTSSFVVGACFPLGARTRLCAGSRAGIDWLKFESTATEGSIAHAGSGYLWRLEGVGACSVRVGQRGALALLLGTGGPLHAVRARAERDVLIGTGGLLLSAQVGAGVEL